MLLGPWLADSLAGMGSKRNLIVVLAHGLRSDALDDSRCWPLQTTNFQKLVERGIRLSATSACPADSGGLVSLLTGLHARQHGQVDQDKTTDGSQQSVCWGWPALLADSGYHVFGVGCVDPIEPWLDDAVRVETIESSQPTSCSYLEAVRSKGMESAILQQRDQRLRHGPFDPDRLLIDCDDDVDGFIAVQARQAITQMPTDRPWALVVIFSGPGNDLPPPTLFEYIVDPSAVEHGFVPADFTKLDALAELDYPRILLQRLEPHRLGRIRADYLGRVSLIDYSMGRLMSAANDRLDSDRIWTVVSSDRGYLLGEQGLVGHRSFLSGAVGVPVIVAPPGAVNQVVYPERLSTVDVAVTIAAIAGCDLSTAVTGRSLLPLVGGQMLEPRRGWTACISEFAKRLMLESERYKVVFHTETLEAIGLFDILEDPDEGQNLIGTPVAGNMLDSLRARLGDLLLPLRAVPWSRG